MYFTIAVALSFLLGVVAAKKLDRRKEPTLDYNFTTLGEGALLSLVEDATKVALWRCTPRTSEFTWTTQLRELFGIPSGMVPSIEAWARTLHDEDRDRVLRRLADLDTGDEELDTQFRINHPTRGLRWIAVRGRLLSSSSNQFPTFIGVAYDVTAEKEVENALRAGEVRFRAMFETSAVAMAETEGVSGRFVQVNQRFLQFTGYSKREIANLNIFDLVHPEDRDRITPALPQFCRGELAEYRAECRFYRKDGSVVWADIAAAQASQEGVGEEGSRRVVVVINDITQLKIAETALRKLADAMPQLVWSARPDGTADYYNSRAYEFEGITQLPDGRWEWLPTMHPEDREAAMTAWKAAVRSKENFVLEHRARIRGQGYRWFLTRAVPVRDSAGNVTRWYGTATDIHEMKMFQAERDRYATLLERIAQNTSDIIYVKDLASRLLYVNPACERLLGKKPEDLLGKNEYEWAGPGEISAQIVANDRKVFEQGSTFEFEEKYVDAEGKEGVLHSVKSPLRDSFGAITGLVGVSRNFTERKRVEEEVWRSREHFRIMGESVDFGVWLANPSGKIEYVSDSFLSLLDMSLDEVRAEGWEKRMPVEDLAPLRERWYHCMRTGEPWDAELRIIGTDGEIYYVWARGNPVRDNEGRIVSWVGVNLDITDRKRVESERLRLLDSERLARCEAERANKIKDEFLATLSHELRTPLNAILGWVHLLKRDKVDTKALAQGIQVIERNARAQAQLISDLLDMSRIISGKLRIEKQRVPLRGVIDSAIDSVRLLAEAKLITIEKHFTTDTDTVSGDPARIQQIVWNILSNAVKFTPRGGHVSVSLSDADEFYAIEVRDTGKGIPREQLPIVFEKFRQLDSSPGRAQGGLGLGLAIVRQLVELHGGTIRGASEGVGKGSVFTVELPKFDRDTVPLGTPYQPPVSQPLIPPTQGLSGLRVLVVDDDPDARDVIRRLLERSEASVTTASSAEEGFEKLGEFAPDVLVSDIGMPGKDGYQFIEQVRGSGNFVPALALTAFARNEDRNRAIMAGYQSFLAKPFEPFDLVSAVRSLSRSRQGPPESILHA